MGSRLLTRYSDGVLVPSLLARLTEPAVTRWPVRMFARLSGTLTGRDRAGLFSVTSSGVLRYRPGPGARINWFRNGSAESATGYQVPGFGATVTRSNERAHHGSYAWKVQPSSDWAGTNAVFTVGASMGETWAFGAWVWAPAGVQFRLEMAEHTQNGSYLSSNYTLYTGTGDWQYCTHTSTLIQPAVHRIGAHLRGLNGQTYYLDEAVLERASAAGPYFDASTLPTAAWLDPHTGQLGTAHNSPSVEWAQAWVEEGTTNEIPDPVFGNATITAHWGTVGAGTTLSRTTVYAVPYGGVAAAQVTCDGSVAGQGLTLLNTVAPAAASGQTKTAQIAARGSGTVKIQIVGLDSANAVTETFESSAITLDDTWKTFPDIPTLTATFANASTVKYVVRLVTTSAQAVTFYVGYVGAEPKDHATSPCHGSLGTGYSWSGTAHASSSTRTNTSLTLPSAGHISTVRGAYVFWLYNLTSTVESGDRYLIGLGDYGTNDFVSVIFSDNIPKLWTRVGAGTQQSLSSGVTVPVGSSALVYCGWDGTATEISVNAAPKARGSRDVPTGVTSANVVLCSDQFGQQHAGVTLGPALWFDRPLTDAELARLYNRGAQEANYDSIRAA